MKTKIHLRTQNLSKVMTTLLLIAGFTSTSSAQIENVSIARHKLESASTCTLGYEEGTKTIKDVTGFPARCQALAIEQLPPITQSLTEITIDFATTGVYTFVKGPELKLYPDRDVYVEDMLTGKVFDFKNSDSYTFNVNRRVAHRFVLHIDKDINKYVISSLIK